MTIQSRFLCESQWDGQKQWQTELYRITQKCPEPAVSNKYMVTCSGVPRNFFRGGVQQIQLRTEDRGDGDLGAAAP